MAKRKEYRYKGPAYMRPCERGINVRTDREPYESLDSEISRKLGIDSGSFYIEVVARLKLPKDYKPKPSPKVYQKPCRGCGSKMHEVHDTQGDSWSCPTCGISDEM